MKATSQAGTIFKEKLVKNTYYEKYKTFRAKAFQLLNHVDEFKSLMVEKFQVVKTKAQSMPRKALVGSL